MVLSMTTSPPVLCLDRQGAAERVGRAAMAGIADEDEVGRAVSVTEPLVVVPQIRTAAAPLELIAPDTVFSMSRVAPFETTIDPVI